jgi:hypothetical protein
MAPLDRFAGDALVALRAAAAEPGPVAILWSRDREGLALAGLVQAAFAGPGPFTILVDPGAPAASAGWRERLARSWDLDLVRLDSAAVPAPWSAGTRAGGRLDRSRGRWEPVVVGPFPVLVGGLRADRDAEAAGVATVARWADGSLHLPLLDWDDALIDAWIGRLGLDAPG